MTDVIEQLQNTFVYRQSPNSLIYFREPSAQAQIETESELAAEKWMSNAEITEAIASLNKATTVSKKNWGMAEQTNAERK